MSRKTQDAPPHAGLFPQELFLQILCLERKRADRSGRPFVLMLLRLGISAKEGKEELLSNVVRTLVCSTRETDVKGWYDSDSTIGVIFTELGSMTGASSLNGLLSKLTATIRGSLGLEASGLLTLSYIIYPQWFSSSRPSVINEQSVHAAKA